MAVRNDASTQTGGTYDEGCCSIFVRHFPRWHARYMHTKPNLRRNPTGDGPEQPDRPARQGFPGPVPFSS
ncbi:cytohesin-4 [Anopheles sinensis]|uniref:Cytohesin-4 n=1 Tax=Anopheles sinensis TaxID=74873 RepID=A0A084VY59_ANOSI|nr:cytohesin-4 [Anopheles sinensis]